MRSRRIQNTLTNKKPQRNFAEPSKNQIFDYNQKIILYFNIYVYVCNMQLNIWIHFVTVPRQGGNRLTSLPETYIEENP